MTCVKMSLENTEIPSSDAETDNWIKKFNIITGVVLSVSFVSFILALLLGGYIGRLIRKRQGRTDVEAQAWAAEQHRSAPNSPQGANEATRPYRDFASAAVDSRRLGEEAFWSAVLGRELYDILIDDGATEQPPPYQREELTSNAGDLPSYVR